MIWPQSNRKKTPEEAPLVAPAEAIWSTSRGDLEHQQRRFGAPAEAIWSTSRGDLEHQQLQSAPPEEAPKKAPAEAIWSTSRGDLEHQQRRFGAPAEAIWSTSNCNQHQRGSTNWSTSSIAKLSAKKFAFFYLNFFEFTAKSAFFATKFSL